MPEGTEENAASQLAEQEALATRVRATLVAAGLTGRLPDVPDPLCHGAGVEVEHDVDDGPGVYVT